MTKEDLIDILKCLKQGYAIGIEYCRIDGMAHAHSICLVEAEIAAMRQKMSMTDDFMK